MTADEEQSRSEGLDRRCNATILEPLTNGLFRIRMSDGRQVVAHVSMELRMCLSRLLPGDPVIVDVSPFDHGKARIRKLLNDKPYSQHESPPDRVH